MSCLELARSRYKHFPSARASQAIAKCRKERGESRLSEKGAALRRWAAEKWIDVETGLPCGSAGEVEFCRPTVRVSPKTPKTVQELSEEGSLTRRLAEKKRVGMGAKAGGDLARARAKLRELIDSGILPASRGVAPEDLNYSNREGKRFSVRDGGRLIHFGSDSRRTFFDIRDEKIRSAWLARHNWAGPPALGTPGWWSTHLLW